MFSIGASASLVSGSSGVESQFSCLLGRGELQISSPPLGVLVGFLFFFSVMIGIDVFLSGEMCREQLISWSLPSLWSLRLLAPVLLG
ncbi:hypothetical protein YC2023_090443 [Brassica napus]